MSLEVGFENLKTQAIFSLLSALTSCYSGCELSASFSSHYVCLLPLLCTLDSHPLEL